MISINPEGVLAVKDSGSGAVLVPQATYNGGYPAATEIKLRIANGGAGQSGLIGEWANAFIQHCVSDLGTVEPFKVRITHHHASSPTLSSSLRVGVECPLEVGWYLGDTTESLGLPRGGLCGRCGEVQRGCGEAAHG
ncbi:hypothetical protein D9615_009318 [Tricholomella constricta]|uniref:Uncharacterized protein n=1 Tax=Tricholomella constricta TaxID=117010 RepID=A0A8H5GW87_9AGAR|nr:hypothetical protein D9615_009318 [Tricholomella constricta]